MARFELKLPKMGESVAEATITNWLKQVGEKIEADEAVLEIATDKVDSEVPSEVSGVLVEQLFAKDDLVQVGQTIAIIETDATAESTSAPVESVTIPVAVAEIEKSVEVAQAIVTPAVDFKGTEKFLSPLVKNIAKEEGVSKLRIRVRAYESKIIDASIKQIMDTALRYDATVLGPVPLPTEKRIYKVNRSSFVYKNAREQFEMRTHKRVIDIMNPSPKVVEALTNLSLPSGVNIDVKML